MLYVFKREALPGVAGTNSRIYTFPTEWSIQFVGQIKKFVDFPLVSVCTGVNVDYAGGQPLALHHDGAPSVVTLTLNFTETTQLNRTKYDNYVSSFKSWRTRNLGEQERGTNINAATIQAQRDAAAEEKRLNDRGGHMLYPGHGNSTDAYNNNSSTQGGQVQGSGKNKEKSVEDQIAAQQQALLKKAEEEGWID